MSRHTLTFRQVDNVKPARAEVDAGMINTYFDELEKTIDGVPPSNLYNYDETNVSDDPGSKTVVAVERTCVRWFRLSGQNKPSG